MLASPDSQVVHTQAGAADIVASALETLSPHSVAPPSGHGGHRLTPQQKAFAFEYVMNGGNGREAAMSAGYAAPDKAAWRNTLNTSIQREVERLSVAYIGAKLPWLIQKACDLIEDTEADAKARITAIFGLMDRAGLKPKSAPLVQVNHLTQINGASAQDAIKAVWDARAQRMGAVLSGIVPPMPEINSTFDDEQYDNAPSPLTPSNEAATVGVRGGANSPGPAARVSSIPPHPLEHDPDNPEGGE